jgi:hypothetical protein
MDRRIQDALIVMAVGGGTLIASLALLLIGI